MAGKENITVSNYRETNMFDIKDELKQLDAKQSMIRERQRHLKALLDSNKDERKKVRKDIAENRNAIKKARSEFVIASRELNQNVFSKSHDVNLLVADVIETINEYSEAVMAMLDNKDKLDQLNKSDDEAGQGLELVIDDEETQPMPTVEQFANG